MSLSIVRPMVKNSVDLSFDVSDCNVGRFNRYGDDKIVDTLGVPCYLLIIASPYGVGEHNGPS